MTSYPYIQVAMLNNSITATTTVVLVEGMQVTSTIFATSAGNLGTITLSPVQPKAVNIEFISGAQQLQIDVISFRAQFGLDSGQVTCNGRATDQDGKNETTFAKQIATWY